MQQKGFTLIEVIIVIVIISIVSSIALITLSHNQNRNIKSFANQLLQLMTLAEHEAMLRPATLGLGFTANSYQFYQYETSEKWVELKDTVLKKHNLPDNIEITLKINDQIIESDGTPSIIFSENSDMTPFVILLNQPGKSPSYQITGDANGTIKARPIVVP